MKTQSATLRTRLTWGAIIAGGLLGLLIASGCNSAKRMESNWQKFRNNQKGTPSDLEREATAFLDNSVENGDRLETGFQKFLTNLKRQPGNLEQEAQSFMDAQ